MLTIRAEQTTVFQAAAVRNFEDRMLAHLQEFAPKHSRVLTRDEMREVIRHGMNRAERHGFTSERSVRIYTQLMLMLGSSFDSDPQLPWATEILNDSTETAEVARIDRLQNRAWKYVDEVLPDFGSTESEEGPRSFIQQLRQLRRERNENLLPAAMPKFCERAIAELMQTLPRKCELLGEQSLRLLIDRAVELARSYDIFTERGSAFFVAGMFMLGSGFDQDPQLPWVRKILKDRSISDQNERVNRLLVGAIDCLRQMRG
jgi:3-methyladenine DNA glycosylase AlkC